MDTFLSLASEGAQGILDACSSSLHKPGRRASVSGAPPSSLDRIIKVRVWCVRGRVLVLWPPRCMVHGTSARRCLSVLQFVSARE